MTDSGTKRARLVASAADLLHRQGVQATTLAHVAAAADVPLGNVYYYFKTKDDLIGAVIQARTEQIGAMLDGLAALPNPADRVKALADSWVRMRDVVARYGCPIGSLAVELDKRGDGPSRVADLIEAIIGWTRRQFEEMGRPDAPTLAITLFARVEGAALVATSLRDPEIVRGQVREIDEWIDSLA
jgi:AcrR family transcriptional regulator